ncbi:methyltransferase domain-containing protein [Streptomyces sp. NBC_01298]|uniref:methyltransferase domain-containing protein n=1 Tax=unclassified Streptomyces TaxID=2593676 RepID=UPI0022541ACC|nr:MULTISPECIES: methyltransferase domain-containing protein [unclassified Streptomyces]MCX5404028.1 methyltransferase domain-containing protein [Streptomyces sp. NBC_00086]WSK19854.1 methyltransferase domain-containing protein [Streptomyces sp. NBC_01298]
MSGTHEFHQRVISDAGAAVRGLTVALGERLGLYRALAEAGPLTAAGLAERTGIAKRYAEEWLHAQLSAGYVERHPSADTYTLPADHVAVLADPKAVTFAAGFFTALKALYATEDLLVDAYRSGDGVGWAEHDPALDTGMGSFFQPTYEHRLVPDWLPALHGVTSKLAAGGTVADVGCGVGHTTLLIAKAFPQATVHGFDYSEEAISIARQLAEEAGLSDRVVFDVAAADDYPGSGYDLVTFFNALHDMGDPVAAAQHVHKSLDGEGTWMLVESNVSPADIDTQTPAARMFMALSAVMCLPVAVAQRGPHALGNHSGEKAFRAIAEEAGFTRWRRATETPVNAVYEVRP